MSTFSVTTTFLANTRAKAAEVNQNFTDVLNILKAHHHDPNLYTNASPITNSGIAANAQVLDTQLKMNITRSGLINDDSIQMVYPDKGGTGLGGFATGDMMYAVSALVLGRLGIGTNGQSLQSDGTKPVWASTTQNALSLNLTSGEAINASTTPQAVYIKASDGKVYLADADADESTYRFVGFVAGGQNVGSNASVTVLVNGIVTGFTGLTQNGIYYVTTTAGTISTTQDTTRPMLVGYAVSTTSLVIVNLKRARTGSTSVSVGNSNTTNTITLGFKPTAVLGFVNASNGQSTTTGQMFVYFVDSGANQYYVSTQYHNTTNAVMGSGKIGIMYNSSNDYDITLNNFTETGFDVNFLRSGTGGSNIGGTVYYIAIP